ncbi:MAG: hypothetical protein PWQ82_1586 [Thermosediminibacterales bacterium]|nr:hypothetical protein [Thermosediminibacterales bacterium]
MFHVKRSIYYKLLREHIWQEVFGMIKPLANQGFEVDYKKGVIKVLGDQERTFILDPLKMLSAVKLFCQLGFIIDSKTEKAIKTLSRRILTLPWEKIRDEFSEILISDRVEEGVDKLFELGLLKEILPELLEGKGKNQRGDHLYDVYRHNLKTCSYVKPELVLRLAGLLHDVGKPRCRKEKNGIPFYPRHNIKSAQMAVEILTRFKYPKPLINQVEKLIYNHLFFYGENSPLSKLRHLMAEMGEKGIIDLIELLYADRKAINPEMDLSYMHRLEDKVFELLNTEGIISIDSLNISSRDIIKNLGIKEEAEINKVLNYLWEKVLESPDLNKKQTLIKLAALHFK